jgi:membrane peptidoglycan carboxypeptidase
MRKFLLASSAMLVMAAASGLQAQDRSTTSAMPSGSSATMQSSTMSPDQRTMHDAWPPERQAEYRTLPADQQGWFWGLTPEQQTGYWAMTPDQRGMIYRMSPEQQAKAWDSVRAQMAGQMPMTPPDQANPPGMGMPTTGVPNPSSAAQAVPPAMPADTSYQGGPYKGAMTPPPADAMDKSYPVCTRQITDSCQNPGEGGAKGRSRAANRRR